MRFELVPYVVEALAALGQTHTVVHDDLLVCACGASTGDLGEGFVPYDLSLKRDLPGAERWEHLRCLECSAILARPAPGARRALALQVLALVQAAGVPCALVVNPAAAAQMKEHSVQAGLLVRIEQPLDEELLSILMSRVQLVVIDAEITQGASEVPGTVLFATDLPDEEDAR